MPEGWIEASLQNFMKIASVVLDNLRFSGFVITSEYLYQFSKCNFHTMVADNHPRKLSMYSHNKIMIIVIYFLNEIVLKWYLTCF